MESTQDWGSILQRRRLCTGLVGLAILLICLAGPAAAAPSTTLPFLKQVMVYQAPGGGLEDETALKETMQALEGVHTAPKLLNERTLNTALAPAAAKPGRLLVVLGARRLNPAAHSALVDYLNRGGDLLVIGATPGPLTMELDPARITGATASKDRATSTIVDWGRDKLEGWILDGGDPQAKAFTVVAREGTATPESVLRYAASHQPGHALMVSPRFEQPFPAGTGLTIFEARGAGPIRHILVEWEDSDGKRWQRRIPLTSDWTRHVLTPEDFHPTGWFRLTDNKESFNPAKARRFKIGLARHHEGGSTATQTFEIGNIQTGRLSAGERAPRRGPSLAEWFGAVSAGRPCEGVTGMTAKRLLDPKAVLAANQLPERFFACGRRARGLGLDGDSPGRWIPWVEFNAPAWPRGQVVAASWLDRRTTGTQPLWSHIGFNPAPATRDLLRACLSPIVNMEAHGLTLMRGGMKQAHYQPGQNLDFGALVLNRSGQPRRVQWSASLAPEHGAGKKIIIRQELDAPPGQPVSFTGQFPSGVKAGDYRVRIELRAADGQLIDVIDHLFSVTALPEPLASREVSIRDGRFLRGGKPWRPVGIHYWLPFVDNAADMMVLHNWLDPALYDPDVVETDLTTIAKAGIPVVVAPYWGLQQAACVRDFLARCERHGLKCQLFLRHADPMEHDLKQVAAMVNAAQLSRQPALYAFDLGWEPRLGLRPARAWLDPHWTRWVIDQYGSVASAARAWGFTPRQQGAIIEGPADAEINNDGPWRIMVAAYRRFADDRYGLGYGEVTRLLRRECPGVLITSRNGYGGNGSAVVDDHLPIDLIAGADHLDFISPEGYALASPWSGFELGKFVVAYARLAGRYKKPVGWMECGWNAWADGELRLETQNAYARNMVRLLRESGSAMANIWWWPGGYRVDEDSDYGVSDESGRPRPVVKVLADAVAGELANPAPVTPPDHWLEIDRDLHPRGFSQIVQRQLKEFLELDHQGQRVGLRQAGDGCSTDDVPLVGVGNTQAEPRGPLKFVNAEFVRVEARLAAGRWLVIERDSILQGKLLASPLTLRATVLNNGVASWSATAGAAGHGELRLVREKTTIATQGLKAAVAGGQSAELTLQLTHGALQPGACHLRLASARTGGFGEAYHFTIK